MKMITRAVPFFSQGHSLSSCFSDGRILSEWRSRNMYKHASLSWSWSRDSCLSATRVCTKIRSRCWSVAWNKSSIR